jgi:hypothetical protein
MSTKRLSLILVLVCAVLGLLTGTANAAFRGTITEARANLKTRQLKVKGVVECFRTPGEPILGFPYQDGCAPSEEPIWGTIQILLHNGKVKKCRPGGTDTNTEHSAHTQELSESQPKNVESISFSFTRKIKILGSGGLTVCVESSALTSIPLPGCSAEPCFYNEVIAARKVQWYGHKPRHRK